MAYYHAQDCGIFPDLSQLNLRPRRLSISRFSRNFAETNVKCSRYDGVYLLFKLTLKKSDVESSSRLAG